MNMEQRSMHGCTLPRIIYFLSHEYVIVILCTGSKMYYNMVTSTPFTMVIINLFFPFLLFDCIAFKSYIRDFSRVRSLLAKVMAKETGLADFPLVGDKTS